MDIITRTPAAVITTDDGRKIVVDKFGKEVKDHGYDLQDGVRATKRIKKENRRVII